MRLVIDASIAVKWLISELGTDRALALYDRASGQMHAPDLLFVEVAGVVVRRANERLIDQDAARDTLDEWMTMSAAPAVTGHAISREMVRSAALLAIDLGHPIKDCVYLALAREFGCLLVTADAKFRDRAAGRCPAIKLLGEMT